MTSAYASRVRRRCALRRLSNLKIYLKDEMKRLSTLLSTAVISLFVLVFVGDATGQLIISEFRVRGPNGANDEFIEIFNDTGADHTVAGGGTGYAIAASNGV